MNFKTILFAAAIGAVSSTSASAQCTDCGPGNPSAITSAVVTVGLPAGGFSVSAGTATNPATGGTVAVPAAVATAIGALLDGTATPDQQATATAAFGGTTAAGLLTAALLAMGANPTVATVTTAVTAYNAAINALPSANSVTPGLLAVRGALAATIQ